MGMDTRTIILIVAVMLALLACSVLLWTTFRHRAIARRARLADARDEVGRRDAEMRRRASSADESRRHAQPNR